MRALKTKVLAERLFGKPPEQTSIANKRSYA
jgi:hypothetical protein